MPIADKSKLIFIHIPKSGGTSVERALGVFGGISDQRLFGLDMQHLTAKEVRQKRPEVWDDYYKFSFTRDTVRRMVSEHAWRTSNTILNSGLDAFILHNLSNFQSQIGSLKVHLMPQSAFLDCDLDFIGKHENLKSDWKRICRSVGLNLELGHHNVSRQFTAEKSNHISAEALDLVCSFYHDDFENFDYSKPDSKNAVGSEILQTIDDVTSSLPSARVAMTAFKAEKQFCELALTASALRTKYPNQPIGWVHGVEALLSMRDFGNARALLDEASTLFDSFHLMRLRNDLARATGQKEEALSSSKQMSLNHSAEPASGLRYVEDLCRMGNVDEEELRKARDELLSRINLDIRHLGVIRNSYRVAGDYENSLKYSMQAAEKYPDSLMLLNVIDDLAQIGTKRAEWMWVKTQLERGDVPDTLKARVRERLTYIDFENRENDRLEIPPLPQNLGKEEEFWGPIHIIWLQGEKYAPDIVRVVIEQWRRLNPNIDVRVYDESDCYNYLANRLCCDLSKIPPVAVADIFRTFILKEYGGVWADSTVLPTRSIGWINEWLQHPKFFVFDGLSAEKCASSWFIVSEKEGPAISALWQRAVSFWAVEREPFSMHQDDPRLINLSALSKQEAASLVEDSDPRLANRFPYFWWHYVFNSLVFSETNFKEAFDERPVCPNPLHAHRLQFYFCRNTSPTIDMIDDILQNFPLHKLSHKTKGMRGMELGTAMLTDRLGSE